MTAAVRRGPNGTRPEKRGGPGLRLHGVVSLAAPGALAVDGAAASASARLHTPALGTPAADVLRVRDLGAVVADARYAAEPLTAELVAAHRGVIEAVFAARAVLPAPPGTVFRSRAALVAWMELHAATLAEGLRYVEDRAEARVTALSTAAVAAGVFGALRREAAALLVLRGPPAASHAGEFAAAEPEAPDGTPAAAGADAPEWADHTPHGESHAAFLVDRGRWRAFRDAAAREAAARPGLRLACDGPWPPYSFVRLDFAS